MSVGPAALLAVHGASVKGGGDEGNAWRSPLVPVALAFTVGILLDRHASLTLPGILFLTVLALIAWGAALTSKSRGLPLVYLALVVAGLGAFHHHYRRDTHRADDVSWLLGESGRIVQVRGRLDEEPVSRPTPRDDPLVTFLPDHDTTPATVAVVALRQLHTRDGWVPLTGNVQLLCGTLNDLHLGDEIETVGRLEPLPTADNPGERNLAGELRDGDIRAVLRVQESEESVVRLESAAPTSLTAMLARVRGWGLGVLRERLPPRESGLAAALLLGDNSLLPRNEWDRYIRSGVVHVLVVSGQHLVILAGFLWLCLRPLPLRQRTIALAIVLILWAYALLAGGRPSVVRAALTVTVFAGGMWLRRPVLLYNSLAAAWLLVLFLNPADVGNIGCLLSFICVAALYWLHHRRQAAREQADPLDQLIDESRPLWLRGLRSLGRFVLVSYGVSLVLWLVTTPLIASRMHFVPLAALFIGPPVVGLTSLALIAGFLLLLAAMVLPPLVPPLAGLNTLLLSGCDTVVSLAAELWQRQGYVNGLPLWWLIGFYLLLGGAALLPARWRSWRVAAPVGLGWLCLLLLAPLLRTRPDELRVTFLAVGHGGCTVLETPDGRTLVYDAGSMRGPEVTRRRIAPVLWARGITRIDELFLSHADLDHFNGVRGLLERFAVGQITCTPSFDQKDNRAVRHIVEQIEKRGVPVRVVRRGDRLSAGNVTLDVLHPPETGPPGEENVRSLVLLVSHASHRLLLTGDLEGIGLEEVASRPPPVDVLMAPHHGSHRVAVASLLERSRPSLIVSSQAVRPEPVDPTDYQKSRIRFLGTDAHGAITLRSHTSGLVVETFRSKERFVLRPR